MSQIQYSAHAGQVGQVGQMGQMGQIGDPIAQLPVDQNPPSNHELEIINTLFQKHRGAMDVVVEESKDSFLVAILVIIFSLPQLTTLINKWLPITSTSPYILLLVKGVAAAVLFWLIKHFYLARKN